jgi:glycosyltransferase 2 family protein
MTRWLIRLIGIAIFLVLLSRLDVGQLQQMLQRTDGFAVALAIGLVIPFFALKSWRWQLLLERAGINVSIGQSLWLYFIGLFAGYATPGQVGEAVKAMYLARSGHAMGPALATIALDRILDMLLLVVLAVPGVLLVGESLGLDRLFTLAALVLALGGLILGLWIITSPARLEPLTRHLSLLRYMPEKLTCVFQSREGSSSLSFGTVARSWSLWLLTLAAYTVHYVRFYVLLLALHISAPPPVLAFVATLALVSVVALVPVTIMGVGTRDGVLVLAAGGLGLSYEEAVGFSLLILLTYLANLAIGFVCWMGDRSVVKA